MKLEYRIRHADLIPDSVLATPITIIGAGAVGSFTALALAKMGYDHLEIWDPDKVGDENVSCQLYGPEDVGDFKVEALYQWLADFAGVSADVFVSKYEPTPGKQTMLCPGIIILAVDSMAVRKQIWAAYANQASATKLLIDPRMGAEQASLYAVDPMSSEDVRMYEKNLYSDADSVAEPCTAKATSYTALMLAGLVAKVVKDFTVSGGTKYPRIVQWDISGDTFVAHRRKE